MKNRCRGQDQALLSAVKRDRKEQAVRLFVIVAIVSLIFLVASLLATTRDQLIEEAHRLSNSGNIDSAIVVIQQVLRQDPNNASALASLGFFLGMKAGSATDYAEAGKLIFEAFGYLDRAVEVDSLAIKPRLWRGLMGVKVPEFMGRLEQGIADLELVVKTYESSRDKGSQDAAGQALDLLIQAYQKRQKEKALECAEKLIAISEDVETKRRANAAADRLRQEIHAETILSQSKETSSNVDTLLSHALQNVKDGNLEQAEEALRRVISIDSRNATAYKELAKLIMMQMQSGVYDERIHNDTNWATNRAFEIIRVLDEAISISPDDLELRLMRGIMGIELPFFVNRLDQGIEDLESIVASQAPPEIKTQAEFYLGYGYQKKGMKYWRNLINQYPDSPVAEMAFEAISPPIRKVDLSTISRPSAFIDFIIGFMDELPPQIALWIEKENGDYVRTIYVSGFSGYAKEVQVVLPRWAHGSNFIDADAATSASIDLGEHCYFWDLTDLNGNRVPGGKYIVNLEVNFWPSGKYEHLKLPIQIGKKDESIATRTSKIVPYFEVRYLHR